MVEFLAPDNGTQTFDALMSTTDSDQQNSTLAVEFLLKALHPRVTNLMTYGYIVWYIVGIPANTLSFIVWMQRLMLNSSGCYMAALAITDSVFLLLHCLLISAGEWFNFESPVHFVVLCQVLPMLYTAAQYMSALLVLAFTVEQFIAIKFPFQRTQYCRVSIARKVIFGVSLFAIALSSPLAYFSVLLPNDDGSSTCTMRSTLRKGGIRSIWTVWTWVTESILFIAVPLTCLLLNMLVIFQITRQSKLMLNRHIANNKHTVKGNPHKALRNGTTPVMLLAVSFYWIFTELPPTVTLGLKQAFQYPRIATVHDARSDVIVSRYMEYMTARAIVEFLCFSRYSCKLFLYLATGRQFRKHMIQTMFRCNKTLQSQLDSRDHGTKAITRKVTVLERIKLLSTAPETRSPPDSSLIGCNQKEESELLTLTLLEME